MPMHVVICGGGVIGACTAYFLARRGIDVTVVERAEVASSASGKAGGFLARDWCAGSPLDALARRSFALHARLHEEIGGWGYQRVSAYSGLVAPEGDKRRHVAAGLAWLSDGVIIGAQLSTTETTAMANPRAFTLGMMRAAEQHGARLHLGEVIGVIRRGETVAGVMLDGETIAADAIVIAMGPWSLRAATWLTLPLVYGLQSPSLVYDTGKDVPAEALFLDSEEGKGTRGFPARRRQHARLLPSGPGLAANEPGRRETRSARSTNSRHFASACRRRSVRNGLSPAKPAFVR